MMLMYLGAGISSLSKNNAQKSGRVTTGDPTHTCVAPATDVMLTDSITLRVCGQAESMVWIDNVVV